MLVACYWTAPQSAEVTGCGAGVAFFITIAGGATAGAVSAWRLSVASSSPLL